MPVCSRRYPVALLYVRAHWLRMPPLLLAWHLGVKALRRDDDIAPAELERVRGAI